MTRLSYADLTELLRQVFVRHGVSEANAAIVAANCAACERDGALSHGIFRMPGYLASLTSMWVNGRAEPTVEHAGPSILRVDAANGFAQPALAAAVDKAVDIAMRDGVAVVAIRDSHHFSALFPDIEPIAGAGLVALTMVSGHACVAAPGGTRPVFGTNPIAFATPVAGSPPLVFDFATSAMSHGNLRLAALAGERVGPGTGIDAGGVPTQSPDAILAGGSLLPFGGHKGAALALMVEVLASAFTGGPFSSELDFSRHPGAETPRTGQFLLILNPAKGTHEAFSDRVLSLVLTIRGSGAGRLPSDRRYRHRAEAMRDGIEVAQADLAFLQGLA